MTSAGKKEGVPPFENCDAFFGVFFWWLLAQPDEERDAILRDGLPIRRLVDEIAPRKAVTAKLRGRGGKTASAGAYPYAVTACFRARDYFELRDPATRGALEGSGADTFAYRRPGVIDTTIVPNPASADAQARGFPYSLLEAAARAQSSRTEAVRRRTGVTRAAAASGRSRKAAKVDPAGEPAGDGSEVEIAPPATRARLAGAPDPGRRVLGSPPRLETARRARSAALPPDADFESESEEESGGPGAGLRPPFAWEEKRAPLGAPRRGEPLRRRPETSGWGPFGPEGQFEPRDAPRRGPTGPRRGVARPPVIVRAVPPLESTTPEALVADYLASKAGPPLVNVVRGENGIARYAGWTADFGREIAPGKRSLDLRNERDVLALLFLAAASSLTGGAAAATECLSNLLAANLVTMSFWRDEGTLLRVGAPRRIPLPQPTQLALHVLARNEAEIRDALQIEEIVAGRKPALDVEKVYLTFMSEKMEMPRYWRGPFKRNRRRRRLLPSRMGRVLVAKIPLILRELRCQGVAEIDPAECAIAERPVRRAMYACGIPVVKPYNRMKSLRANSRAIHERFGELYEMPLLLYGRSWRRR